MSFVEARTKGCSLTYDTVQEHVSVQKSCPNVILYTEKNIISFLRSGIIAKAQPTLSFTIDLVNFRYATRNTSPLGGGGGVWRRRIIQRGSILAIDRQLDTAWGRGTVGG
jgi:hypothetical protein